MYFQVKIELQFIKPVIWRRFIVPSDYYLSQLHEVIQNLMGWTNSHLHQFIKNSTFYTIKIEGDMFWGEMNNVDYGKIKISDLVNKVGDTLEYEYDFGNSWLHTITLEEILHPVEEISAPYCIEGELANPGENAGSPFAFMDKLNKNKGNNEKMGKFDPEKFNKFYSKPLLSYCEMLMTLTKESIISIGNSYGITFNTSLRKEEIASLIEEEIIANPSLISNAFSYNELSLLNLFYKNSKTGSFQNMGEELYEDDLDFEDISKLLFFCLIGTNYCTNGKFIFPEKIKEAVAPVLEEITKDPALKQAYQIENIIIGSLTLYGALPITKISEIVSKHLEKSISIDEIRKIICGTPRMRSCASFISYNNADTFYYPLLDSPLYFLKEISRQTNIGYKEFTTDDILDAAFEEHYFPINESLDELSNLLERNNIEGVDLLLNKIWLLFQNSADQSDIFELVSSVVVFKDFSDIQVMLTALANYGNSMPKWILKGNSSDEIFNIPVPNFRKNSSKTNADSKVTAPVIPFIPVKVSRNELCPCGSGKKYKNCCGNN